MLGCTPGPGTSDDLPPLWAGWCSRQLIRRWSSTLSTSLRSDKSLKPIVLMAHLDEVPVPEPTYKRWTHPPFDGHVDKDGWIWGRGSGTSSLQHLEVHQLD